MKQPIDLDGTVVFGVPKWQEHLQGHKVLGDQYQPWRQGQEKHRGPVYVPPKSIPLSM